VVTESMFAADPHHAAAMRATPDICFVRIAASELDSHRPENLRATGASFEIGVSEDE
jgi:hypothetical protein